MPVGAAAVELALLLGVNPTDGLLDFPPGGPLGRIGWRWPQHPLRILDMVAGAVVDDRGGGVSPGPPAPGALGNRAELLL
jgi:hypothetical protein